MQGKLRYPLKSHQFVDGSRISRLQSDMLPSQVHKARGASSRIILAASLEPPPTGSPCLPEMAISSSNIIGWNQRRIFDDETVLLTLQRAVLPREMATLSFLRPISLPNYHPAPLSSPSYPQVVKSFFSIAVSADLKAAICTLTTSSSISSSGTRRASCCISFVKSPSLSSMFWN